MNISEPTWQTVLLSEFEKDYFKNLSSFVTQEYANKKIYPSKENIFKAFELCPFDKVKVVIMGQDPYHTPGMAHGLAFSVPEGVKFPPSLRNIFKEMLNDLGTDVPAWGDLSFWAKQGVLLLNATLTVEAHKAGSHQKKGWEQFTDAVINALATNRENLVYILWGAFAQKKATAVDQTKNLVLESVHPSPLSASRGFFGNHHFSLANNYLKANGSEPIAW